ncbi:MAG: glycosyltransferase family 9 protein [Armatimonadota bacterium]|nr:glycosyltransferase family 9 protein [Armatimonadota bacterium]
MNNPEKIVCFHLNQLGDLMFTLPALYNLRHHFPKARIVSVARSAHRELLTLTGLVDNVLERPYGPWSAKVRLALKLRRERFDIAVLFSMSTESAILAAVAGPKAKVGFRGPGLTYRVKKFGPPSISNSLRLVEAIGCPIVKNDYVGLIKLTEAERQKASDLLSSAGLPKFANYAVLAPGSTREIKQWTHEGFVSLASLLHSEFGFASVIVGAERDRIIEQSNGAIVDLLGKTSLADLAAILERAKVFVGVDSGVMHLAAAMGVPVVALFGPTRHDLTGPLGNRNRIVTAGVPCAPCMKTSCNDRICMRNITVEKVVEAVGECLREI